MAPTHESAQYGTRDTSGYYGTLGVDRAATPEAIAHAYKKLARQYHPDRHVCASEEERTSTGERFKAVAEAYEVLSDEKKRRLYDAGMYHPGQSADDDDDAAQGLFEAMYMQPKKRRVTGGALFVAGGQFFQRTFAQADVAAMRDEMTHGLPEVTSDDVGGAAGHGASTSLPHGSWEVRVVEADEHAGAVHVTLCPADEPQPNDEEKELRSRLRVERTFRLPHDADVARAQVEVDEAGARLRVTAPARGAARRREAHDASPATLDEATVEAASVVEEARAPALTAEPAEAAKPDAAPTPTKKPRRRGDKARASGLKAGFLNAQRAAAPTAPAADGTAPMDVERESKAADHGSVTLPPPPESPPYPPHFSVRDDLDKALRAQMDELVQERA